MHFIGKKIEKKSNLFLASYKYPFVALILAIYQPNRPFISMGCKNMRISNESDHLENNRKQLVAQVLAAN